MACPKFHFGPSGQDCCSRLCGRDMGKDLLGEESRERRPSLPTSDLDTHASQFRVRGTSISEAPDMHLGESTRFRKRPPYARRRVDALPQGVGRMQCAASLRYWLGWEACNAWCSCITAWVGR